MEKYCSLRRAQESRRNFCHAKCDSSSIELVTQHHLFHLQRFYSVRVCVCVCYSNWNKKLYFKFIVANFINNDFIQFITLYNCFSPPFAIPFYSSFFLFFFSSGERCLQFAHSIDVNFILGTCLDCVTRLHRSHRHLTVHTAHIIRSRSLAAIKMHIDVKRENIKVK